MEVENISLENLRIQHAHLDAVIKEEESHIWKNCIKIEELKKQKLRKNAAPDYANSRSLTKRILSRNGFSAKSSRFLMDI